MPASFRIVVFGVTCALVLFLVSFRDTPRAAAIGGPGLGCNTHSYDLSKSGSLITAGGEESCDALLTGLNEGGLTVDAQRLRWWGWETMSSSWSGWRWPSFYVQAFAVHDCAGTGTHTFRGAVIGELFPSGSTSIEFSPEHRWSC